jgi:GTPase SAR1 family protein
MATPVQPLSENVAERDNTLREMFQRFRVLILGRANAGKTTILQKVCNTDEQPEIFDSTGKKVSILNISDWSFRYNCVNRAPSD